MFADDSTCLNKNKTLQDLETSTNEELSKIADWFIADKMSINSSKTKYMIFHPCYKVIDHQTNLLIKDSSNPDALVPLERITNQSVLDNFIRSLGVLSDENLTFQQHITSLSLKLTRALFHLYQAINTVGFIARKQLYFSLIHSNLLYCNLIYGSASAKNLKRLFLLQKRGY